jgi:hypothetical protein
MSQEGTHATSNLESMPHGDIALMSPPDESSKSHNPCPFLENKAREASIVPFSIFTELFTQRFKKNRLLELTMEILQQFYIAVEDPKEEYQLFPGDQYKFSVKCKRSHKCVSSPNQGILETMSSATVAMLRHWNIISSHDDSTKKVVSTSLPLLFSSQDAYDSSIKMFESSMDKTSEILRYPFFCSKKRYGEFNFCEAVKADISIQ